MSSRINNTYGEQAASKAVSRDRRRHRALIRASIKEARSAEVRNDFETIGEVVTEYLGPALIDNLSGAQLHSLREEVSDEYEFHGPDLWSVLADGNRDTDALLNALRSLESVAMERDIVRPEMRNYAPAKGFALPMGRIYKSPKYHVEDEVHLVSYHSGETKTLYQGKTGYGKSTGLSNEVADRWYATCQRHWYDGTKTRTDEFKIIDVIDTDSFENACYDIPQRQGALRDARLELGLSPDFEGIDGFDQPNIEVLVPLVKGLEGEEIPINQETGETVVKRFTVAASDLSKRALKYAIAGSTDQQESIIGMAYDRVEHEYDDWTLRDLGEELLQVEGASDQFKQRALNNLVELQRSGFIRDKSCDHRLDWERIFTDTETITAFSQGFMDEYSEKLMVLSYLMHSLYWERKEYKDLPRCVIVGRELHEVVPHDQENNGPQEEQALRKAMMGELSYMMKKNRKQDIELLFDTQDITDLKMGTRKRFNRGVSLKQHESAMEEAFAKIAGNKNDFYQYKDTIQDSNRGEATIVGASELEHKDNSTFITNVKLAPPPWHVYDDDESRNGLHERVRHLEAEEWGTHDWETTVPDEYMFTVEGLKEEVEKQEADDSEDEFTDEQKKEMAKQEARRRKKMGESIRQIRDAIPNNPKTGNPYSTQTIHRWTKGIDPDNPNDALA